MAILTNNVSPSFKAEMKNLPPVAVIIVTHNSKHVIGHCLQSLIDTGYTNLSIIITDSGSSDTNYLTELRKQFSFHLIKEKNIGFSRANNLGYHSIAPETEYIVFLNPDAFPEPDTFYFAVNILMNNPEIGCLTGKLLAFDQTRLQPTDLFDSTGIFRKWYGQWYDRGQGERDMGQYQEPCDVPAICGAFMFFQRQTLDEIMIHNAVFHPIFFLYKEDIELCLRVRKAGWRLVYHPALKIFHCRGWQKKRSDIPYELKKLSAKNEILLYRLHPSPYIIWALFKYLLVYLFSL